ncbi:hypothetical protein C8Q80DRAFT_1135132 [Daedaleopsis nitida]|nr:hypothetical protein C8Q80DRAFT_1135132 [Daedaleopsis nitida]
MDRELEIGMDYDLLVIDLAGRNIGRESGGLRNVYDLLKRENKQAEVVLPPLRKATYPDSGVLKKAAWWYDRVWASEATWCSAAIHVAVHAHEEQQKGNAVPSPLGMYACITYIANCADRTDYGDRLFKAFGCSIPFAMAARWSGRPFLFRPLNLFQRLLLVGWLVGDLLRCYQRASYITRFREYDKAECARFLKGKFGLDVEDARWFMDHGGSMPPFYKD